MESYKNMLAKLDNEMLREEFLDVCKHLEELGKRNAREDIRHSGECVFCRNILQGNEPQTLCMGW